MTARNPKFLFEPLTNHHKRTDFRCGVDALDRYLQQQAGQDARSGVATPFVMTDNHGIIAGYYTLSANSLSVSELPFELVRQLKLPRYPYLPVTLIGRLARDIGFKGRGLGELLLMDALNRSLRASREVASFATIVDAKDEQARKFYSDFGFISLPNLHNRLFMTQKSSQLLFAP